MTKTETIGSTKINGMKTPYSIWGSARLSWVPQNLRFPEIAHFHRISYGLEMEVRIYFHEQCPLDLS